ncbi:MAG: hypothetical protein HOE48_22180 [Candidatus Latescibacteria bacterium]|nr:hypothetical protein [Candidatus Latescibacterota bacterium]
MGAGLTPKVLCNTRLYKGALCLFFPPAIATFAFFVLQDTPMNTAIPLALIAGTSVILFLPPNSKINGEIIPLGQLTTGLGFLFWIIFTIDLTTIWQTETVLVKLLDIALFGVLLEAVVQICKHVRTEIAQHLTLISLAYVLAIATVDRDISPFILAFPSGIFLSIRNVHAPLLRTPSLSDAILSFVLISLALDVSLKSPFIGTYAHTITLGFYFIVLIVGKVAGGILAQRLLGFPPKVWFALIPQGLVALFCLHQTPNTIFSSHQGSLHTLVLLSFTALSVLYPISITLWSNIKRDPLVGHRPS